MSDCDVLVVGAGISGLALAFRLRRNGVDARLLDAGDEPGGNLKSERVETEAGEWLLDLGPNSWSDHLGALTSLVSDAGLDAEVLEPRSDPSRRFLYLDGALTELPSKPPRLLLSGVLPWTAKLRLLAEPLVRARAPDAPEETLAAFCDRRLGRAVRERLLTPFVGGIYAGDPERLGAASAFPKLVELEREHGSLLRGARRAGPPTRRPPPCNFRGGMATLARGLADALGPHHHAGAPVRELVPAEDGWEAVTPAGRHRTRHLVLATPAHVTSELLRPHLPEVADELAAIRYAPMVVVHVGLDRSGAGALPEGFGFLVPRGEGVRILGAVRASGLFAGRAPKGFEQLAVFVGGELDPDAALLDDAGVRDIVVRDLRTTLGTTAEPELFRVTRWPRAIPQYEVGHLDRLARIDADVARRPRLSLLGNWKGGISLPQCVQSAEDLARRLSQPPGDPPCDA